MSQKQVVTTMGGTSKYEIRSGVAMNSGAQVLTVPTGKRWKLISIASELTASATVGNRLLFVYTKEGGAGSVTWVGETAAATTAAQVCGYDISFGVGGTPSTTVRRNFALSGNTNVQVRSLSPMDWLNAGDTITFKDAATIDNADTLSIAFHYIQYEA